MTPAERAIPRPVTEQDVLGAIVALGSLPKRGSDQAEIDLAAYRVALDGVASTALADAVRNILRGELGHAFFPSPPEFRMACDRADAARQADVAKQAERDRRARDQAALKPVVRTEAEKQRAREIYERFIQSHAAWKLEEQKLAFRSGMPTDEGSRR